MSQRIRGDQTQIVVTIDGTPITTLADVKDFDITAKFELLEEGYLGESTDRYDEIFKGASFRMMIHYETEDPLTVFLAAVQGRAQQRTPGTLINIRSTLNFPGGDRPRVSLQDCHFGPMPFNFPARDQYGNMTIEGAASDIRVIG